MLVAAGILFAMVLAAAGLGYGQIIPAAAQAVEISLFAVGGLIAAIFIVSALVDTWRRTR